MTAQKLIKSAVLRVAAADTAQAQGFVPADDLNWKIPETMPGTWRAFEIVSSKNP
ncbi:hypothetical protein AGMMS49974_06680 [Deltaproteobacteria bacterium]|nr:hypothetical protein AGMMS49974_06680 [Deltaproteobacteria bacterium]GHU99715.1 hypothetical protein AGMMS50248_08240 [Deltaproteobacteria bacterium]